MCRYECARLRNSNEKVIHYHRELALGEGNHTRDMTMWSFLCCSTWTGLLADSKWRPNLYPTPQVHTHKSAGESQSSVITWRRFWRKQCPFFFDLPARSTTGKTWKQQSSFKISRSATSAMKVLGLSIGFQNPSL